jgi:hypothetical protein
MITYIWKINEMIVIPSYAGLQDIVKSVGYSVTALEDGYSTDITLSVELNSTVDPDKFIAYEDLTEETVISWVQPMTDMIQLESRAQIALTELRTPAIVAKPLPWTPNTN